MLPFADLDSDEIDELFAFAELDNKKIAAMFPFADLDSDEIDVVLADFCTQKSPSQFLEIYRRCAGITDLLVIIGGIILWIVDIGTDVHVTCTAYTEHGAHWGNTLAALLISSFIVIYCAHIYTLPLFIHGDRSTCKLLKAYPVLLLGPLGR